MLGALLGADVSAAGALVGSLLLSVAVSVFVSLLLAASSFLAVSSPLVDFIVALLDLRLSVIYQPPPLNTMPTG